MSASYDLRPSPVAAAAIAAALAFPALAEGTLQAGPIWSQIVVFPLPEGFASAFETARGGSYIQEFVPEGQTVTEWKELVTLTGARGHAAGGREMFTGFVGELADGYARACPDSFRATKVSSPEVPGAREVFAGHLSCINVPGAGYSEAMTFVAVRAGGDIFTLQWAARDKPGSVKLIHGRALDESLRTLTRGFRLCPRVDGEVPPYPSCTD